MVFARNMKQSVQPICGNAFVSLVGQDTTAINQFAKITVIITDCARSQDNVNATTDIREKPVLQTVTAENEEDAIHLIHLVASVIKASFIPIRNKHVSLIANAGIRHKSA